MPAVGGTMRYAGRTTASSIVINHN